MMTKKQGQIKDHRINTIQVIYREPDQRCNVYKKTVLLGANLVGASLISWIVIILIYEIPCFIGEMTDTDLPIIKTAIRAEQVVTMKHRTNSHVLNRLIHEFEEMKVFYSQI